MEELVDGERWRDGGKEVWTVGWRNCGDINGVMN